MSTAIERYYEERGLVARDASSWLLPGGKMSMSRARLFDACPRCFYEAYIAERPGRVHIALPVGSAVHAGVQHARTAILHGLEVPAWDEVADVTRDAFVEELGRIEDGLLDTGKDEADESGFMDQAISLAHAAMTDILPGEVAIGVSAVEVAIDYGDLFPFTVEAYADVILSDLTIKDLKTSATAKAPDMFAEYQLGLYGLPWHRAGQSVQLQIDQIIKPSARRPDSTVAVHRTAANFEAVEAWFLETADAISTCWKRERWPIRLSAFSHRFEH